MTYFIRSPKFCSLTKNQMAKTFYTNLPWFAKDNRNSDNISLASPVFREERSQQQVAQ